MNAKFLPPSAKKNAAAATRGSDTPLAVPSDRACCCASRAAIRVLIPPAASRARPTDLLLCGHHYLASRQALAAARAEVSELPGLPSEFVAWLDRARLATLAAA